MEFDLSAVDAELLLARGKYATVRGACEDAIKALQKQAGELQSIPSIVLRKAQEGERVDNLLETFDKVLSDVKRQCEIVFDLYHQKEALKTDAWGK